MRRIILAIFCISLTGCSTVNHSKTFRNRNFDYERVNVNNLDQPIKTPSNLSQPNFTPMFNIPPGQNTFPPGALPSLTPPSFDQNYEIPALPATPTTKTTKKNFF